MVEIGKIDENEPGASPGGPAVTMFLEVPLDQITLEKQIRSQVDTESESFQALMESIISKGVLEPVLVVGSAGNYRLLSGERRYLACRKLGLPTIPARVLGDVAGPGDVISIQLIENLLRQDLDPIDQANACVDYFRASKEDITLDEIVNHLVTYNRDPQRVPDAFSPIIGEIVKFTGKSINTIINGLTLLRLPDTIQQGLKSGIASSTIGYVFAANIDCPRIMNVYRSFLKSPKTAEALKRLFKQYQDADAAEQSGQAVAKKPFQRFYDDMKSTRAVIEKKADAYAKADIEQLLQEVEGLGAFLKERLQRLSEGAVKTVIAMRPLKAATAVKRLQGAAAGISSKGSKRKKATPRPVLKSVKKKNPGAGSGR